MKKPRLRILLVLMLTVCIGAALPGLSASAENIGTYTVGQEMGWIQFYQSGLPVTGCELSSGGLPAGVQMVWQSDGVYVTGIPENTGSFIAEYIVSTEEGATYATVSFSVQTAPVAPVSLDMVITKHPTGERVEAGGTAKFIARADNAERIVWRLVSPGAYETVQCANAPDFYPGLEVSGLGTDTLVLSRIPKSLDGWYVEAQFWNGDKHLESNGAEIVIVDEEGNRIQATPAPSVTADPELGSAPSVGGIDLPVDNDARTANIVTQPEGIELRPGESYTLSVVATSPNNGSLTYQWYSAATDNRGAALPITGASDASYTVNQADGTAYYWVAVWNTREGSRSQPVYSEAAEVRIVSESVPSATPEPTPEPTPAQRSRGGASSVSFQLVLFGIIGLLALASLIGVVIYLRADAKNQGDSKPKK